jgi:hypothetical protein
MLLGSLLLVAGLLSCGRRGSPVPPRPAAPAAVRDLRAEPFENAILLTWNRPAGNEDGSPLTDLLEFRLFRAVGPAAPREARGRPAFSLLATVRADRPDNAVVEGDRYAFRDDGGGAGLTPGLRYGYRVQGVNRRGVVGTPSAEISTEYSLAPPAPIGLTAVAGSGVVNLRWQPPVPPAGAPALRGYNIYRALQPGAYAPQPINGGPIVETQFRDAAVENDVTYYYVVRSVGGDRPPWRESGDSSEVSATPIDLVPPAPPRGLTAIPGPGVVSLSWNASAEPDLLGYLVYRREPPTLTPARLTETPIQSTTFPDRTVRAGTRYVYTVTAVDGSPRRNESAPSSSASVTIP